MENIKVWIKQDINKTFFVWGTYFYNKVVGDIKPNKPYTTKEKEIKTILEDRLKHYRLDTIKRKIEQTTKEHGFKSVVEVAL